MEFVTCRSKIRNSRCTKEVHCCEVLALYVRTIFKADRETSQMHTINPTATLSKVVATTPTVIYIEIISDYIFCSLHCTALCEMPNSHRRPVVTTLDGVDATPFISAGGSNGQSLLPQLCKKEKKKVKLIRNQ